MKTTSAALSSPAEIFPRSIPTTQPLLLIFLDKHFSESRSKRGAAWWGGTEVKASPLSPAANVPTHGSNRVGGFPPEIQPQDTRKMESWWPCRSKGHRSPHVQPAENPPPPGQVRLTHGMSSPCSRASSEVLLRKPP